MSKRIKGKTLIEKDEGDDAYGVTIKVYGEETNGAVGIIEQTFEPGFLLPPHVHENDVWLYILDGEMHVRVSDEVVKATPGCWVLKPRRIPHTMWNAGPEPARIIEVYTPGGFELFFKDFGKRLGQGPIGLEELNRLGDAHGTSVSSTTGFSSSKRPTTCASLARGRTLPGRWLGRCAPSDAGSHRTENGMDMIMVTGGLVFTGRQITLDWRQPGAAWSATTATSIPARRARPTSSWLGEVVELVRPLFPEGRI
jgi:quercetin dioxygenase-like cupin family protein